MNAGERTDSLNLTEEDRLPWLEPAGGMEAPEPVSLTKIFGLIAAGLLLLGGIVAAGYWLKNRDQGGVSGTAPLIAAENDSYKVAVNASDAKAFEGEGDEAFAASEGLEASGRIDAARVPEAPRDDLRPAALPIEPVVRPAATKPTVSAPVQNTQAQRAAEPTARAAAPTPATTVAAAKPAAAQPAEVPAGPRVQLGAFASRAIATDVWKKHTSRFDYLSGLNHSIEPVESNGKTLFRLRVAVASQKDGSDICGRLRVAGENCMVVR